MTLTISKEEGVIPMKNVNIDIYLKRISEGVILSILILLVILGYNEKISFSEIFFYETMPNYKLSNDFKDIFSLEKRKNIGRSFTHSKEVNIEDETYNSNAKTDYPLIGLHDITYQDSHEKNVHIENIIDEFADFSLDDLRNIEYLKNKFYIVDGTGFTEADFNVDKFISTDLKINKDTGGPKILIFHTHSQEKFADSVGEEQGVIGAGKKLAEVLEKKYGIKTMHNTDSFDVINGRSHITGSYERMEVVIEKILKDNPSIEVAIDLHRDGLPETSPKLVKNINGKDMAQFMVVNGLSKMYKDGVLQDIDYLKNPNLADNLAFSFNFKLLAEQLYPGLTRKIFLKPYRYSVHMLPKSLLVEMGAQNNTEEEISNSIEPLAEIIATILLREN